MSTPAGEAGRMAPGVKCLLVDDLEDNLLVLSALLKQDDVEILMARSGAEALELLLVHDVALAFLDVQMPEMDGFELAELMRGSERTRNVPIIFVTAGVRDTHRMFRGYEMGAVDFLYKPIDSHVLRSKADVFFQLHRQKQQLARQLAQLTETLRLNEMFTAILGHDLRNPLSAILNSAHVLQYHGDEKVRDTAQRMLGSGRRMSSLIEDILDFARARLAGGIALRRGAADLGDILGRVLQEQRAAHPQRQIELRTAGDLQGYWDAARLAQVASNLSGNAIQHGLEETVHVDVDGSQARSVTLEVRNAGTIPPELLPVLFDPFRGSTGDAGREQGLGLGLFIVQQIVQAHGGRIDVSSADGRTAFRVELPRGPR